MTDDLMLRRARQIEKIVQAAAQVRR